MHRKITYLCTLKYLSSFVRLRHDIRVLTFSVETMPPAPSNNNSKSDDIVNHSILQKLVRFF